MVHTPPPVPASPIFTYGRASDPPSLSHDSPEESVTPKVNPKPFDNSLNTVPNLPEDPDSDPSSSDSSLPDLSDSSYDKYYKQRRRAKKYKNKHQSKTRFDEPIKKCANLTDKLHTAAYKSKVIKLKLYKDTLHTQFYFLSFMNSLKILLSQFSETYMLIMEYPSTREE